MPEETKQFKLMPAPASSVCHQCQHRANATGASVNRATWFSYESNGPNDPRAMNATPLCDACAHTEDRLVNINHQTISNPLEPTPTQQP